MGAQARRDAPRQARAAGAGALFKQSFLDDPWVHLENPARRAQGQASSERVVDAGQDDDDDDDDSEDDDDEETTGARASET